MTDIIQSTFNNEIPIKCFSVFDKDRNERTCRHLRNTLNLIGEQIDISSLADVSIAYGDEAYLEAIAELDSNRRPSSGSVIGIAMTLDEVKDAKYVNHIVLHQNAIVGFIIDEPLHDDICFAIQTLAHESAHVYSNMRFHEIFGNSLQPNTNNPYHQIMKEVACATWSEYSACLLSANIGLDPTQDYLNILSDNLEQMDKSFNDLIQQKFSNLDLLLGVFKILGNIVKFAGYYIGCVHSFGLSLKAEENEELLQHEWILPYLSKLEVVLQDIANKFGDESVSEVDLLEISNIFIEVAEHQDFYIGTDELKGAFIFTHRK